MKKLISLFIILMILCGKQHAQLNQNFESASTLGKAGFDVSSFYSSLQFLSDDSPEDLNKKLLNNTGFRFGMGLSEKFDLQITYSYITNVDFKNQLCISPKYSIYKNKIAAKMPLSFYFGKEGKLFTLSPKIVLTQPVNKYFDISIAPQAELVLGGPFESLLSAMLGVGLSKNL